MSSLERVQVQRGKQGRRGKDAMLGFPDGRRHDAAASGFDELKVCHL